MLSGIGPSDELNRFNITPIHVNEYIGRYGQDHFYLRYYFRSNMSYFGNMTNSRDDTHTIHDIIRNRTEYFDVPGPGALSVFLSTGSYDRLGFDYNNIRLEVGLQGAADPTAVGTFRVIIDPQVYSKNLTVKLTSLDSRIFPAVYQNYFSDSRDYDTAIEAVSAVRKIIANQSIFIDDEYNMSSMEEWREFIWRTSGSSMHAVGTVTMGSELMYPVDEKCSVRGVHNLRVVDLSLWPESTNSGTQSLTYMLGEKCVQYIINDNRHTTSWWHKNQNSIIIAVVAIIVLIVIVMYHKNIKQQFI